MLQFHYQPLWHCCLPFSLHCFYSFCLNRTAEQLQFLTTPLSLHSSSLPGIYPSYVILSDKSFWNLFFIMSSSCFKTFSDFLSSINWLALHKEPSPTSSSFDLSDDLPPSLGIFPAGLAQASRVVFHTCWFKIYNVLKF